ncbi:putative oligopeptide ABC transporter, permease protein AppB [Treponema lecithinolyticum ATCC 700332]|jgi:putative oligopeptide ABC transporter, permease protein appB|uniref:Oligopeptide ABC transporter, permease protein AppB n=2 Tax=Treponema lecithinolyticum TaxID=53418 RepID=A0ABN0NXL9_TRELE|nr:putative oligopeptide ABC transporter, permease protein AppB [Treponema lecithinolyticum ATCC 700332]
MLLVISFLIYGGLELMPGDAVSFIAGPEAMANMSPEKLDALREALGLNKPFLIRYLNWLGGVLRGNFGYSLTSGTPIAQIVKAKLAATLELSFAALCISSFLGCLLGIFSALRKGSFADTILTVAGMLGLSIPEFFFGLCSLLFFAINNSIFPIGGRLTAGNGTVTDRLYHLILPALVMGLAMSAGVMRYARSSMLDSINKDYIKTARSKGLPEWRVNLIHGFRTALTPIIVLIGFRLPTLIGGSVVIEQVFQWPGVGSEFIAAVRGQNYPLVMMIALLSVTAVLLASFLVDLLTAILDPRVRLN